MSADPVIRWYLSDDSAESGILSFTPTAGTPTSALTRNLWNDKGNVAGSSTATEVRFVAGARQKGSSGAFESDHPVLVAGAIQFRLTGQSGTGIEVQTTPWTPLGPGRDGLIKDLPKDCKRVVQFRFDVNAGYGSDDVQVQVDVHYADPATFLDVGYAPAGMNGVCHGVGDGGFSAILEGGVATANGSPDNKVDFTTLTYIHKGKPYCLVAQERTYNNLDSAAAALASGETYWVTVSVGASGYTETKSVKATGPQSVANRPAVPDGELLVCYIEVEFDATIEQADIYQTDMRYGWFAWSASGLVVTIQTGWAIVDGAFIRRTGIGNVTLVNATTNYLFLTERGVLNVNQTGTPPTDRAMLLYAWTTAGSAVTATVDRRDFIGKPMVNLQFDAAGTIVDEQKIYRHILAHGRAYILPLFGVSIALGEDGDTTGSTKADLETSDAGGSWTTIFTSFGTVDLRPSIPHNSTTRRSDSARPEVFEPPLGGRIRLRVDSVSGAGGTPPADLSALVRIVLV